LQQCIKFHPTMHDMKKLATSSDSEVGQTAFIKHRNTKHERNGSSRILIRSYNIINYTCTIYVQTLYTFSKLVPLCKNAAKQSNYQ